MSEFYRTVCVCPVVERKGNSAVQTYEWVTDSCVVDASKYVWSFFGAIEYVRLMQQVSGARGGLPCRLSCTWLPNAEAEEVLGGACAFCMLAH